MGLFDTIQLNNSQFVCSQGHSLMREMFQSKDFGCTMSYLSIEKDGLIVVETPRFSKPEIPDTADIYGECPLCPVLVQDGTWNMCPPWLEFTITIQNGKATNIQRISPDTHEYLADQMTKPYMEGCHGPMSMKDAQEFRLMKWHALPTPLR